MRTPTSGRPRHRAVFLVGVTVTTLWSLPFFREHACAQEGGSIGATVSPVQPPPPPDFDPATEPAVRAVAQTMPAVVNIATERVIRRQVRDPFEDFYERFFGESGDNGGGSGSRVLQQKVKSLGSGFVVDADGLIVTNEHVVERAADLKIQVTFADGSSYPARYLAGDPKTDLAIIKIEPPRTERNRTFPHIDLGTVSPCLLGQTVLALGNPVGYNSSVSRGILSAKNREITIDNVTFKGLLQTDAAINPGNSGGPLIDLAGRLVGMSSVKMAFTPQGTPTQGLGFAIPAKLVADKVTDLRRRATASTADGGTSDRSTTPNARRLFGLTLKARGDGDSGLLVAAVEADSPASRAGIRSGMIVLKVGTYAARDAARIDALLRDVPGGTAVDFTVGPPAGNRRSLLASQATTVTLQARVTQEL